MAAGELQVHGRVCRGLDREEVVALWGNIFTQLPGFRFSVRFSLRGSIRVLPAVGALRQGPSELAFPSPLP